MPHCYQVNFFGNILAAAGEAPDTAHIAGDDKPGHSRAVYELPPLAPVPGRRQGVVFANFNKVDKHEPASFRLFMQILLQVRTQLSHTRGHDVAGQRVQSPRRCLAVGTVVIPPSLTLVVGTPR